MEQILILVFVGIVSGMAIGMQGPMASMITQQLGMLESVFIVHLGGVAVSIFPLILFQGGGKLSHWRELPWYVFLAGAFGLIVLASVSFLIPRIGASSAIILIMVGQVIIGVILDHFGLLGAELQPITLPRVAGILVIFLGLWITLKN
jgi:transporter family-2 protein